MTIKFNRRSVCMGDDVMNGIYKIEMQSDATVGELVYVTLHGGNGNTWPIPSTDYCWIVYSNIGLLARVCNNSAESYFIAPDTKLSDLSIRWVYADAEDDHHEIADLDKKFD